MFKVNIVAVGKVKEKYFEQGIAEYSKRMSRKSSPQSNWCAFGRKDSWSGNYKES